MIKMYEILGVDPYQNGEIMYTPDDDGVYIKDGTKFDIKVYDTSIHDFRAPTKNEREKYEIQVFGREPGIVNDPQH